MTPNRGGRPAKQPGVSTCKQRKMVCDGCDWSFYATRGPLAERLATYGRMPTCLCGHELRFDALDDAGILAGLSGVDAALDSHPAFIADMRRTLVEEAPRGPAVSAAERKRCEMCASFLVGDNIYADCTSTKCGHSPEAAIGHRQNFRSERQQRRSVARRAARKRDPMPF